MSRRSEDPGWNKHSFYCADEDWDAASEVAAAEDSNLSREIRRFLHELASRAPAHA